MIELGAYEIVPAITKRCLLSLIIRKLFLKQNVGIQFAESAAKQSKRELFQRFNACNIQRGT